MSVPDNLKYQVSHVSSLKLEEGKAVPLAVPLLVQHSQYTYSMLEGGQFVQHAPQGPDVTAEGWCLIRPPLPHSNTHSPLVIVWPVLTDLWREVVWSPNTCPCQLHSAVGSEAYSNLWVTCTYKAFTHKDNIYRLSGPHTACNTCLALVQFQSLPISVFQLSSGRCSRVR